MFGSLALVLAMSRAREVNAKAVLVSLFRDDLFGPPRL